MSQPLESNPETQRILFQRITGVLAEYEQKKDILAGRVLMMRGSAWRLNRMIQALNQEYTEILTPLIVSYAHVAAHSHTDELVYEVRRTFSAGLSAEAMADYFIASIQEGIHESRAPPVRPPVIQVNIR